MGGEEIVFLSFGGGQDSTAILYKCVFDPVFQLEYVGSKTLVVVFCDTGNEYPETYEYLNEVIVPFCQLKSIEFHWLTPDKGFHGKTWPSLQEQFKKNRCVMSVSFPKSCTDNLKIKPFYRFVGARIGSGNKVDNYYSYFEQFGKINVMIGIARGEESRAKCSNQYSLFPAEKDKDDSIPVYRKKTVNVIYPLIEVGYNRYDCQHYIESVGLPVPEPSNCMFCPFQNEKEVVLLKRKYPEAFKEWVGYEYEKMLKNIDKPTNLGVKGKQTLNEYIHIAEYKCRNVATKELEHYRFSHGHHVKSKF